MSEMQQYDLNVILDPNLSESQLQTEKDAIAAQIKKFAGEVVNIDEWGNKRLAYEIRKQQEGYYIIYVLKLIADAPKAIESSLRLRDNVMRALVIRERPEWKTRRVVKREEAAASAD